MAEKQAHSKVLLIVGAAVLLGAAGFFAWRQSSQEAPPPPPATVAPKPTPDVGPDKQIEGILVVSGLDHALKRLPEAMLESLRQAGQQDKSGKLNAGDWGEMERLMRASFTAEALKQRIAARLKKYYDARRYQAFLDDISTPLARRMTELEKQEPKPDEVAAYVKSLASKPLSPERAKLIERLDVASRAGAVILESTLTVAKGMARGFAGSDAKPLTAIDKTIDEQRAALESTLRDAARVLLAYTYRDVGDADLAEYVRIHEQEGAKLVLGHVYDAMLDVMRESSERFGGGLEKLVKAKLAEQAAAQAKGKPEAEAPAAPTAKAAAASVPRGGPSRVRQDARACLRFEAHRQVMGCAERFR